ncbi:MAG: RpoL/Rpb11 RNA polymerase subunit family protein [Candidatus Pacearchaeota archaeon]
MELKVIKDSKDEMEIEFDNLTITELVRTFLNKDDSVTFAAWRREHPTKNPILAIKTKGKSPKKAVNDAVTAATKELERIESEFSKLK